MNEDLKQAFEKFTKTLRDLGLKRKKILADFVHSLEKEKLENLRKKLNL